MKRSIGWRYLKQTVSEKDRHFLSLNDLRNPLMGFVDIDRAEYLMAITEKNQKYLEINTKSDSYFAFSIFLENCLELKIVSFHKFINIARQLYQGISIQQEE